MSQHTPGPWSASNEPDGSGIPGWNIFGADGSAICGMMDVAYATAVNAANARLIAQAPSLLAALRAVTASLDGILSKNGKNITGHEMILGAAAIHGARALISEAEGSTK